MTLHSSRAVRPAATESVAAKTSDFTADRLGFAGWTHLADQALARKPTSLTLNACLCDWAEKQPSEDWAGCFQSRNWQGPTKPQLYSAFTGFPMWFLVPYIWFPMTLWFPLLRVWWLDRSVGSSLFLPIADHAKVNWTGSSSS